jgi:hypothetical protein
VPCMGETLSTRTCPRSVPGTQMSIHVYVHQHVPAPHCTLSHRTAPHRIRPPVCPSIRSIHPVQSGRSFCLYCPSVRSGPSVRRFVRSFRLRRAVSVLRQNTPPRRTAPRCIVTTALTPIDSNSHLLRKESSQARSSDHGSFAGDGRRRRRAERARRVCAAGTLDKKYHARPSRSSLWHNAYHEHHG